MDSGSLFSDVRLTDSFGNPLPPAESPPRPPWQGTFSATAAHCNESSPVRVEMFDEASSASRAFDDALRDYCQRDLENCMIMWKRERASRVARSTGGRGLAARRVAVEGVAHSAEYLQFLQDEFPENIKMDAQNPAIVANVDARVCCERWEGAFARLSAETELRELGPPPEPPCPPPTSPSLPPTSPPMLCSATERARSQLLQAAFNASTAAFNASALAFSAALRCK